MKITCEMATDLAALYKDGLASEDSKSAVESHLAECPQCRKYYKNFSSDRPKFPTEVPSMEDEEYMERFRSLSVRLKKQRERTMAVMSAVMFMGMGMMIAGLITAAHKKLR